MIGKSNSTTKYAGAGQLSGGGIAARENAYGTNYGATYSGTAQVFSALTGIGITNEANKSGIVADFSSNTLVCKYIIKY